MQKLLTELLEGLNQLDTPSVLTHFFTISEWVSENKDNEYVSDYQNALQVIRNNLMERRYTCPSCQILAFTKYADPSMEFKDTYVCEKCGEILTKVPDLKKSDIVKIIGYDSPTDIDLLELDDEFMKFLQDTNLMEFKIMEFDPYACSCLIDGFSDWIEAEIFEKIEENKKMEEN